MAMKFLVNGFLRSSSGVGVGTSLHETYTASTGQDTFALVGTYRKGIHELQVFLNGVRQTVSIDYTEVNSRTVQFAEPLEDGDTVLFFVPEVINQSFFQKVSVIDGQTIVVLSGEYHVGMNTLQVYENGMLLTLGDDYNEIDNRTIEFLYPLSASSRITVRETM